MQLTIRVINNKQYKPKNWSVLINMNKELKYSIGDLNKCLFGKNIMVYFKYIQKLPLNTKRMLCV